MIHTKYALALIFMTLCTGCAESKYEKYLKRIASEERGYMEECGKSIIPQVKSILKDHMMVNLDPETNKTTVYLPDTNQNWAALLTSMNDVLPPESLETMHNLILRFLNAKIDGDNDVSRRLAEKVDSAHSKFIEEVLKRQPITDNVTYSKFVFTPPLPIGQVSVENGRRFRIETGSSINTPLGSIGATNANTTGVTRLIIRSDQKKRIFRVDRPFQVFVPADYGIEISGDGGHELIIDIRKR